MENNSIDTVIGELNKIKLDPEKQTYSEYMAACDKLEDLVIELAQTPGHTSKQILRNLIPAFEFQDTPTEMILSGIYFSMDSGDFLKEILYETELNELFEPVVVEGACLETPNQMFTQRTRYNIAEFLYGEDEIDENEFAMFTNYDNQEEGNVVDTRDIWITGNFYKNLSDEEQERMADDSEVPLLYLEQLKNLDVVDMGSEEYEKAISTMKYALRYDKDLFMLVANDYIKNNEVAREDSKAYMTIVDLCVK